MSTKASRAPLASVPVQDPRAARPSDSEVIRGLSHGERWAADALYERAAPAAERTLRSLLRDSTADREDLLQITLERVVRTLVETRFAGACSLASWASAIGARVAVDALRARIRERRIFQYDGSAQEADGREGPAFERRLEARRRLFLVQRSLAKMKPDQAQTVVLHDVLGYELREVAVLTDVSVAAAQSRLVRGRLELLRRARAQEDR